MKTTTNFNENWNVLTKFFPKGWTAHAKSLKLLMRKREIKSVGRLLRILLIHLLDGCSLRETVARAKIGKLADISDVALLKKLKSSSEWFRWMSIELLKRKGICLTVPSWLSNYNIKTVDASVITEPGSTGTDWRLHYSLNLFKLKCDQFIITKQDVGESFTNFKIEKNDLFIADRAYGRLKGLNYIKQNSADFITRLKNKSFSIRYNNKKIELTSLVKNLKRNNIGEWNIEGYNEEGVKLNLRICAIKKSKTEGDKSIEKALKEAKKKQKNINNDTLELHRYIILVTSLPDSIPARLILELYRYRWQIEIGFKRLKSIMKLGHLPKKDKDSCFAWLHGKIFISLLAEAIVDEGRRFSPWGYPL